MVAVNVRAMSDSVLKLSNDVLADLKKHLDAAKTFDDDAFSLFHAATHATTEGDASDDTVEDPAVADDVPAPQPQRDSAEDRRASDF